MTVFVKDVPASSFVTTRRQALTQCFWEWQDDAPTDLRNKDGTSDDSLIPESAIVFGGELLPLPRLLCL